MIAPLPVCEFERLNTLRSFGVLDTPSEPEYDDLTKLAAAICNVPIAVVSLVDSCRQWFKSRVGIDAEETHRDIAFCAHAILQDEMLIVPDATQDPRFSDNPIVTGEPHIRFYAGMPLTAPDGHNVGTLCVVDMVPRTLTEVQTDTLRVLARQVIAQFVLRRQFEQSRAAEAELRESEERFRHAFEDAAIGMALVAPDGRWLRVNRSVCDMLGYTPAEMLASDFQAITHPGDLHADLQHAKQVLAGEIPCYHMEKRYFHKDGRIIHVLLSVSLVRNAAEEPLHFIAQIQDITARKKAEGAVKANEAKFRSVVDGLAESVFLIDVAGKNILQANAAFISLVGFAADEIAEMTVYDFVAIDPKAIDAEMKLTLEQGRSKLAWRQLRRKDGALVDVEVSVSPVSAEGQNVLAVVLRDTTEQRAYEDQLFAYQTQLEDANTKLRAVAITDGLTGVRNRAAFNDKLAEEYDRSVRFGRTLSVILLDVDHFKLFNDTFGHPAGDDVLKSVASILRKTARTTDMVARYGGEEFAVILPDTDYSGAMVLAERFRRAIAGERWEKRPITVSVGVSTYTHATAEAGDLVQEADTALYRSKQAGRNRVHHSRGSVQMLLTSNA